MTEKVPAGTRVLYHGQVHVVRGYNDLSLRTDLPPEAVTEGYPDGTAYELWPEDVPFKFGNREQATYFVRRTSFEPVEDDYEECPDCKGDIRLKGHTDHYDDEPPGDH